MGRIELFKPDSIIIPSRFCGPKNSGHGGYTAGTLAQYLSGPVEVTIKRPIPIQESGNDAVSIVSVITGNKPLNFPNFHHGTRLGNETD